jgi:hypothetical protein
VSNIYKRQHWIVKVLFWLVVAWLVANIVLATASADVYDDNLNNSVVTEQTDATMLVQAAPETFFHASIPAGCHGRVWRKSTVYIRGTGIVIAWRRTAIDRWCNNTKGQIYDWGVATGDDGKWSVAPYCWYDVTFGKHWWTVSKSEAKVWNQGTLKVCGRLSLQRTVNPRIYFHSATNYRPYRYWNFGGVIYH